MKSVFFILVSLFGLSSFVLASEPTKSNKAPQLITADELKWQVDPHGGPTEAIVAGNSKKGAFWGFHKFPKGASFPLHTHTAEINATVVSGTFAMSTEGTTEKQLGPGSYIYLPSNAKHTTKCVSETECVLFAHYTGKFDVKMDSPKN